MKSSRVRFKTMSLASLDCFSYIWKTRLSILAPQARGVVLEVVQSCAQHKGRQECPCIDSFMKIQFSYFKYGHNGTIPTPLHPKLVVFLHFTMDAKALGAPSRMTQLCVWFGSLHPLTAMSGRLAGCSPVCQRLAQRHWASTLGLGLDFCL